MMKVSRPGLCRNRIVFFSLTGLVLLLPCSGVLLAAAEGEIDEWLQAHNSYRSLHGTAALTWSDKLAASARGYAETCSTSHSGLGYGENLAWASYDMGSRSVVKMWYAEEARYDYSNPGFTSATGHFSQLIWKGSREIGCGHAGSCGDEGSVKKHVWVCQYNPPGNYRGEFRENVLTGQSVPSDRQ